MATKNSTMAMDAMIDSLKRTSFMVEEVTSKGSTPAVVGPLPMLKSMVFSQPLLCSACRSVLHRGIRKTDNVFSSMGLDSPFASHTDETSHHSLEELAREAIRGCQLCLLVYLGLDSDSLKKFAKTLAVNAYSTRGHATREVGMAQSNNIGLASITQMSEDKARLSFRYIRTMATPENDNNKRASIPITASVKSNLVTSFDFANFESQRASIGYFFENPSGSNLLRSEALSMINELSALDEVDLRVDFALVTPQYAQDLGLQVIPMKSVSTASDDAFNIARSWIRDCVENHIDCVMDSSTRYRPTYLLDISITDGKGIPGVKLVDGILLARDAEYVTLSHAWGQSKPLRLHKGTYHALRQGVAQSNLPKTLAEAMTVTKRLGYKYLWVDALCIRHDDEQAVLESMSQMDMVYGNAVLNIAATCASDDTEGFLRPRNVDALQPCLLDVEGHTIDDGTYMLIKSSAWNDLVENAPLQQRAWVLQERTLAKRTLHFTQSELMWECQKMCCSETYPKGVPDEMKHMTTKQGPQVHAPLHPKFNKDLRRSQAGSWAKLVELYSTGELSYQSDKLPAIAGLARQHLAMNGLQESDYIVGLWRHELAQSLLWNVDRGFRPSTYRAPTWSWASVDGPIRYPVTDHPEMQLCLGVLDIDLKHRYDDRFLICQDAKLEVCGFLAHGSLRRDRNYWDETACTVDFSQCQVDFQVATFDTVLSTSSLITSEVYVLPIVCTANGLEGLFLTPTNIKGQYQRLGTFGLSYTNGDPNCDQFKIAINENLGLARWEANPDFPDRSLWFASEHKYLITLV